MSLKKTVVLVVDFFRSSLVFATVALNSVFMFVSLVAVLINTLLHGHAYRASTFAIYFTFNFSVQFLAALPMVIDETLPGCNRVTGLARHFEPCRAYAGDLDFLGHGLFSCPVM